MDQLFETANRLRVTRVHSDNKMWLAAEMDASLFSDHFKVKGYVEESYLATAVQWQRLSAGERNKLVDITLSTCGVRLEFALAAATAELSEFLTLCAAEGLDVKQRELRGQLASGTMNLAMIDELLAQLHCDMRSSKRQVDLATQISKNLRLADYPDTFLAASKQRQLIAVLGPTNSGKTYDAFKRLESAKSGAYLGPLRLLALEAYTRLNEEFGVKTSLVTGEERRIIPGSSVTASTVEMLDATRELEVAVIDEIQMLMDKDRGWAWTQAVVGANASEIWLLGSPSAEPAIRALAEKLRLPLEVRYKERKCPLVIGDQPLAQNPNAALKMSQPGDAFIVFSRRDALNLRDDLLGMQKSVACIYGALSPEVREREATRFASGEADILVATDAIGMGLNLPIKRVVFTSVQKYDGESRKVLTVPLLQQIGGRAGRYGQAASEAGVVLGLTAAEHAVVARSMKLKQAPLPVDGFLVTPGITYLEQLADMAGDHRLEVLLSLFMTHCDRGDRFYVPHVPEEQLSRAAQLDRMANLSLPLKHVFSMAPMPSSNEDVDYAWRTWARLANGARPIQLNFLPDDTESAPLEEAENTVRLLSAYRWFGYRLPELFVDYEQAEALLGDWVAVVDEHLRSRRCQGVGGGRKGLPSWYWPSEDSSSVMLDERHLPSSVTRRRAA